MAKEKTELITARVPISEKKKFQAKAEKNKRSPSFIIKKMIEDVNKGKIKIDKY